MSLVSDALSLHASSLNTTAGETVIYRRGTSEVAITAVVGQSEFDEFASDGEIRATTKTVDWLIRPAALDLGSGAVEPQRGDQVERSDGETFDLLPGNSGKSWEWSDSRKTFFRIHTVRRVAS